ncbi:MULTISPECIES: hypothetical protein [Providencia]|uniref:hypothetical protein n=1 Tax=Providencia TaxID=586 RepID=UPI001419A5C0|nr:MULTISPECIES: hypothetical protein [Providencia]NIA46058.1 hypothetical protein [Providencia rettgeri]NIA99577.1 hypothetical protein [Providencia rettgeri]NIB17407.1 hypothetical protein [Providencia rettgeri]NIB37494.1 hypothetical protein [Providencia rettgeri]NIL73484.1 hypothetical protein [Providencia sp. 504mA]
MEIEFLCDDFKCEVISGCVSLMASGVKDVELSDSAQSEVLRTAISEDSIILHLESQGYTVTKD